MLDRIIITSSNKNSIVLDCFCGSGTTLKSAHLLNRQWIGIDQSEHAIKATIKKIESIEQGLFMPKAKYEIVKINEIKTPNKSLYIDMDTVFAPLQAC